MVTMTTTIKSFYKNLTQEVSDQYGQKLVGSRAGEQLTIAITHANDAGSRVMLSFVTSE